MERPVKLLTMGLSPLLRQIISLYFGLSISIARALSKVDVQQIPDMPDRIVAATALQLNVPLISRDGKIRLSTIQTIW